MSPRRGRDIASALRTLRRYSGRGLQAISGILPRTLRQISAIPGRVWQLIELLFPPPDPTFFVWGCGPIGDGSGISSTTPRPVAIPGVVHMGGNHTVNHVVAFAKPTGVAPEVWIWGNDACALALGGASQQLKPAMLPQLQNALRTCGWGQTSFAVVGGEVFIWGSSPLGAFCTATKLGNLSNVRDAYTYADTHLILKYDGTVWGFGSNADSKLQAGGPATIVNPIHVYGLQHVQQVRIGVTAGIALHDNGTVSTWGVDFEGETGRPGNHGKFQPPDLVPGLADIAEIAMGNAFCLALTKSGSVLAWGYNFNGQTGRPSPPSDVDTPKIVPGLANITSIQAGYEHSLALDSYGRVWAWGQNQQGQLGDGTTTSRHTPAVVPLTDAVKTIGISLSTSFASTYNHPRS